MNQSIAMKARTIEEARKEAIQLFGSFSGKYCIICNWFGLFLVIGDRFWKNAPSDAWYMIKKYYHNGIEKDFSAKQIVNCQDKGRD
mgnify:CR=1 FL=1